MAENPWAGTIAWLKQLLLNSAGQGTPMEGMKASLTLFAVTFASNFVGLIFTIVLDFLFFGLFLYNAGRYVWGGRP